MATVLDVSGAKYPAERDGIAITPPQGVSLRPLIAATATTSPRRLFWEHEGNRAVRDGQWKLVAKGPRGPWELYDLTADRAETTDLAAQHPERVKELAAQWEAWAKAAHVLPWPWDEKQKKAAAGKARFDLGPDADLAKDDAPDYPNRAFTVTVNIGQPGKDGVLVAQGGDAHGWALFFEKGALHFAINRAGKLEDIATADPSIATAKTITASLAADGSVTIRADDREILQSKFTNLPAVLPADGLQVGRDLAGTVGNYVAPFAFDGKIRRAVIELSPR